MIFLASYRDVCLQTDKPKHYSDRERDLAVSIFVLHTVYHVYGDETYLVWNNLLCACLFLGAILATTFKLAEAFTYNVMLYGTLICGLHIFYLIKYKMVPTTIEVELLLESNHFVCVQFNIILNIILRSLCSTSITSSECMGRSFEAQIQKMQSQRQS